MGEPPIQEAPAVGLEVGAGVLVELGLIAGITGDRIGGDEGDALAIGEPGELIDVAREREE
jgi:hypothetical protein